MLVAPATGVATYARALRTAQKTLSGRESSEPGSLGSALVLSGGAASAPAGPQSRTDPLVRSIRSILPWGVHARDKGDAFVRHDVFRLGQAFFTLHRRSLPVHVPGPPGIMHWSYPVPLHVVGWRNLYTVHDVIPLMHPDLSPIDASRHRRLLLAIAKHTDRFVAVSRSAAQEIVTMLDLDPERIVDCSQPIEVEDPGYPQPLPQGLKRGQYLLVCGTVEPRKNIERIVAAYQASGVTFPLVLAGPDGWQADTLFPILAGTPGLVRLPYQTRASMISLVAQARVLLMPSLAEGFGLPVGEAMVLGTPVVTSSEGALAETAGGAAILVPPLDTAALSHAIATIASDDALCRNLSKAGKKRAALFSPAAFADRISALYDEVSAGS